jgi:hypothetical protein
MMDATGKILAALDTCSAAAFDSDGNIGLVYLPTEQIGVIVSQALCLRAEIAKLEDMLERAVPNK